MKKGGRKAEIEVLEDVVLEEGGALDMDNVSQPVADAVRGLGVRHWFSMQRAVIDCVLLLERSGLDGDVILAAPTGSGKTLAYAVPIVEALRTRVIPRLRAVVLVPTRDLAKQVSSVFEALCTGAGLAVAVAVGQGGSLEREARELVESPPDVLVATPGRLVHHVRSTPGFTLAYLRFFVADESDRLLQQEYNDWVQVILPAAGDRAAAGGRVVRDGQGAVTEVQVGRGPGALPVRKILASATQTRNPKRLAGLQLRLVRRFHTSDTGRSVAGREPPADRLAAKFATPATLTESALVLSSKGQKPAALIRALGLADAVDGVGVVRARSTIVFVKSVASAHKLARLLELAALSAGRPLTVLEFSASLSSAQRRAAISALDRGKGRVVVVCSDVMARGIDATSVEAVINYDIPVHVRTYLHRVGRTARAGQRGSSLVLVSKEQLRHFKGVLDKVDRGHRTVAIERADASDLETSEAMTPLVLAALEELVHREQLGMMASTSPLLAAEGRELLRTSSAAAEAAMELSVDGDDGGRDDGDDDATRKPSVHDSADVHELIRAQLASIFRMGAAASGGSTPRKAGTRAKA